MEGLLTDNLKLTKEVKEANRAGKAKAGPAASDSKLHDVQEELSTARVKLIEKEREIERLDAQLKSAAVKGKSTVKR